MPQNRRRRTKRRNAHRRPKSGRATGAPTLDRPSPRSADAPASRDAWPGLPGDGPRGPHCEACCNRVSVCADPRDPDYGTVFWPCETPGCAYYGLGSGSHLPPACIEPLRPDPRSPHTLALARFSLTFCASGLPHD
ncbi:unnamed protein product [marine sediment metagenome]|uniref:Uncharacterized protein n=1 Tax=marine sediment metagenome TaxID=412755 RepID=X1Q919_9ZZZZ